MNKITILINNVIVIGDTEKIDGVDGIVVKKPHSIQKTAEGFALIPLFEAHIGQEVPEIEFQNSHVLSSLKADNNELLQAYLKKISDIVTEKETKPSIVL